MTDILTTIAEYAKERVAMSEKKLPLSEAKRLAEGGKKDESYPFERALSRAGLSLICEIKKASPSKGIISEDFPYLTIAREYEQGGADCISCLTEPKWFLGSDKIFTDIKKETSLPMLRKDFTVSEYQIYESKLFGASAVLLIMSITPQSAAKNYLEIAHGLGMSVVAECRDEEQIEAAQKIGAKIIGVNNRNLRDFSVDIGKAGALRGLVDRDRIFVGESGVMSLDDLKRLKEIGADACLVGEFCMRARDRVSLIREMKNV